MSLRIEIARQQTAFEPGEDLAGTVSWQFDSPPRGIELRLFWFTRGKGTEDVGVAQTLPFDRPAPEESRPFRLRLPDAPLSFSGKLISLVWALELVAAPSKEVARVELVAAPGKRELQLESVPGADPKEKLSAWRARHGR